MGRSSLGSTAAAGGAFLVSLALFACSGRPAAVESGTPAPITVKVIEARAVRSAPEVESFGTVSYRSKADISAAVEGTAVSLAVDEGDRVRPGQLLAQLENVQLTIGRSQAESQLRSTEAAVELAKARLLEGNRQIEARLLSLKRARLEIEQKKREADEMARTLESRQKLVAVDGISAEELRSLELQCQSVRTAYEGLLNQYAVDSIGLRDEDIRAAGFAVPVEEGERSSLLAEINLRTLSAQLDAASAARAAAQSDLESAAALLDALTIRSPVAGVIGARQAGVGERLRVADTLFTVIEEAEVYAVFPVAERQAAMLACGMPVEVVVPGLGGRRFSAAVSLISPLLDPVSGNLTVRALIPNHDGALRPGLFVRVRVRTGESRRVIPLPASAVARREGARATIFVVRDGRAFKRTVELEAEISGETAGSLNATAGIEEGERIVAEPSPALQEGGAVHVQE